MKKSLKILAPVAAFGVIGLLPGVATAQDAGTSYQANLQPVPINTPAGAASGDLTLTLNGDQATVTEHVSGLGPTLPKDTATLTALGVPAAFAGKPFPHVQHIHINGQDQCPTAAADTNGNGVISIPEGAPAYGGIGTTLSMSGTTAASAGDDVTVAPSGGSFTYQRTFTVNPETLTAIKANKAVIVVHGLNPANAPKSSLSAPNQDGITLPGAPKKVAEVAVAPALCGVLQASQMTTIPSGAADTGNGASASTNSDLIAGGTAALAVAAVGGVAIARRRRTEG